MNKNCQLFYKRLRTLFPSIGFAEGKFLRDIKMQLRDYSIENHNAEYEDVVKFFGNPEDVYVDYIRVQGREEVYQKFQVRKCIHRALLFLIIVLLGIWLTYSIIWWNGYKSFHNIIPTTQDVIVRKGANLYDEDD